jgi:hypothetical protein
MRSSLNRGGLTGDLSSMRVTADGETDDTKGRVECSANEENSPSFDRRVSPLAGAATQESNVWVLSVKGRKKEKLHIIWF